MRLDGLAGFVFRETPFPYPQKSRAHVCEASHSSTEYFFRRRSIQRDSH
jgi:hypothetical protein